ncbi:ATP-binding protein [Cytophagaceae bacterium ABcell3]|nr:ATP-binding protein [Cytophagaceae bacterium ABcell3]
MQNLKDLRSFVSGALESCNLSETEVNLLVLAVDEVCANLIVHACPEDDKKFIEVTISDNAQGITFEITDSGEPFDVNAYPVNDVRQLVKEKKKGGLGLMLVKKIVDSIETFHNDKFTVYRLHKRFSAA